MTTRLLCAFAAPIVFAAIAFAQLDTATISGRVLDSTGAAVPGAELKVINVSTNFESVTVTNAEGLYRVPSLRPGPYRIIVSAAGFKQHVREGI